MADYKTRLTADTSQHDQALSKSAQQVYKYSKSVDNAKVTLGGLVKKFAPLAAQIGIAGGAIGTFNKALRSTEQGSDALDRAMYTAKSSVDRFFQSITSGSFNIFTDGLHEITKAAREAYNALDDLGTMKMWNNADIEKQRTIIAKNKSIIYDRNATLQQKKAAQQAIDNAIKEIERLNTQLIQQSNTASQALLREYAGTTRVTTATLEKYRKMLKEGTLAKYAEEWKKQNSYQTYEYVTMDANAPASKMYYTKWNDKDKEVLYNVMQSYLTLPEEKWQSLLDIETQNEQRMQQLEMMKQQAERTANKAEGGNGGATTVKVKAEFEHGSIAEVEKEIQALNDRLRNENLRGGGRQAIEEEISALKAKKSALEDMGKPVEHLQRAIEDLPTIDDSIIDGDAISQALQEAIDEIKEVGVTIDDLKAIQDLGDGIGYLGDMFSSLSDIAGESMGGVLDAVGKSVGAIGTAIAKIAALMEAEGAASAMELPFPANLAALASVIGAVTAVISSIQSVASQSFAEGGIFQGKTSIGDYNLARINSGEMILNSRQQQHLFKLINNPTITTTSTDGGNVTFTIHGSDLQGTLNNYNKRVNRVR